MSSSTTWEVLIDEFGMVRDQVPCATETNDSTAVTRAAPCTDPVMHEDWMAPRGIARIADGGLIPDAAIDCS